MDLTNQEFYDSISNKLPKRKPNSKVRTQQSIELDEIENDVGQLDPSFEQYIDLEELLKSDRLFEDLPLWNEAGDGDKQHSSQGEPGLKNETDASNSVQEILIPLTTDVNTDVIRLVIQGDSVIENSSSAITDYLASTNYADSPSSSTVSARKQARRRAVEKGSTDYRERRERNNIAVRKSRDKAKQRQSEIEEKVHLLRTENEILEKKYRSAAKQLNLLCDLFSKSGMPLPKEFQEFE